MSISPASRPASRAKSYSVSGHHCGCSQRVGEHVGQRLRVDPAARQVRAPDPAQLIDRVRCEAGDVHHADHGAGYRLLRERLVGDPPGDPREKPFAPGQLPHDVDRTESFDNGSGHAPREPPCAEDERNARACPSGRMAPAARAAGRPPVRACRSLDSIHARSGPRHSKGSRRIAGGADAAAVENPSTKRAPIASFRPCYRVPGLRNLSAYSVRKHSATFAAVAARPLAPRDRPATRASWDGHHPPGHGWTEAA